jgi:competence protein ComEA
MHSSRTRIRATLLALSLLATPLSSRVEAQPIPPAAHVAQRAPNGVVNLNTASGDELERLPGIGPSRARAILELRARLKRFARVEDLMRVKGIGRATYRRLRPLVTLEGPTTLAR